MTISAKELEPGVDALLHVSQISRERVENHRFGQVITAKVVTSMEKRRKSA